MIDLHVHSNHSDGTCSPDELVSLAQSSGVSVFALTDHDTVSGVRKAKDAAAQSVDSGFEVSVISGVEISAAYQKKDIHILGLFVDETNPVLLSALEEAVTARDLRNEHMAERFRALGIPLTLEDLRLMNPDTVITRAHFANYLIKHGHVKNSQEAFFTLSGLRRTLLCPARIYATGTCCFPDFTSGRASGSGTSAPLQTTSGRIGGLTEALVRGRVKGVRSLLFFKHRL